MLDFGFYNMDCMEGMAKIPNDSIDCVVTDCPYHIVSGGGTIMPLNNECGGILSHRNGGKKIISNVKSGKLFNYNDIEFKEWLPQVYRILKYSTHCYIMINSRNLKELWQEAENVGFEFQNLLVWDKGNATPNKWYMQAYELILMLRKGGAKNINNMGTSNILRIPNIIRNKKHPTEKPIELMKILIQNSTNNNDVVLDPFVGSGSTLVAAEQLGRNYIGFEIDEKYFNIANDRIKTEIVKYQYDIFDYLKGGD